MKLRVHNIYMVSNKAPGSHHFGDAFFFFFVSAHLDIKRAMSSITGQCQRCTEPALYGFEPGRPLRCPCHRLQRQYNVVALECCDCGVVDNEVVCFGTETRRPIRCTACRTERDLRVWPAPRCSFPACTRFLLFGVNIGQPLLCAGPHAKEERLAHPEYRNVTRVGCIGEPGCDRVPLMDLAFNRDAVEAVLCRKCARRRQNS